MSIILGFVTSNCCLVASDGRHFVDGKAAKKDNAPEDYDKTFVLRNGKIIGAVSGTMEFQGRKIGNHLDEILTTECKTNTLTEDSIKCLYNNLKIRLQNIPIDEIGFQHRRIDLILVTSLTDSLNDSKMYTSRFQPSPDNTSITIEEEVITPENKKNVYWKLYGDDSAQNAIHSFLMDEIKKLSEINEGTLRSLCYKTVRKGIKNCSHPKGDDLTCGGKVFVKSIK